MQGKQPKLKSEKLILAPARVQTSYMTWDFMSSHWENILKQGV